MRALLATTVCFWVVTVGGPADPVEAAGRCVTTVPARVIRPAPVLSAQGFNHGYAGLRVQLAWPNGRLAAGILPDGGSLSTVDEDGAIHAKVGWWRGVPGRLLVTGQRLDAPAPPLESHVPAGYGQRGFQPTGLVFPTTGCWRVVGRVGEIRLSFVVEVVVLPWR